MASQVAAAGMFFFSIIEFRNSASVKGLAFSGALTVGVLRAAGGRCLPIVTQPLTAETPLILEE